MKTLLIAFLVSAAIPSAPKDFTDYDLQKPVETRSAEEGVSTLQTAAPDAAPDMNNEQARWIEP